MLQAAQFGLAMLDRAYPAQAPFTAQNTTIIATGLSNGGGAVLQAAGMDDQHLLAGVVALEPNVHAASHGRALYDYATEAAIWAPCALVDTRFAHTPFARGAAGLPLPAGVMRCANLHAQGKLHGSDLPAQAAEAYQQLRDAGWSDDALATSATTAAFDVWRAVAAGYASAYLRRSAATMPCGFHYAATGAGGLPGLADPATRATWWSRRSRTPSPRSARSERARSTNRWFSVAARAAASARSSASRTSGNAIATCASMSGYCDPCPGNRNATFCAACGFALK